GCAHVGALEVTSNELQPSLVPAAHEEAHEPQPFPWDVALFAAAVIASLLGLLLFGVPAAIVGLVSSGRAWRDRDHGHKGIFIATVLLCLLGVIAGIFASHFWWLRS